MKTPRSRNFSLGTATDATTQGPANLVADAVAWLLNQRNPDDTWGGPDNLDRLVSTCHVLQTLLCCGFADSDPCVKRGLDFLAGIDKEANVSFFWRAGVFLNLPGYESLVSHDIGYIWKFRTRIGAHKDYPVPFFLLKLLRFAPPAVSMRVDVSEVLKWVLSEWKESECWYGRTSITSMALALVHDLRFRKREQVVRRCVKFLVSRYQISSHGGGFSENLIEDAFLIFNLCERSCLAKPEFFSLTEKVSKVVKRIIANNKNGTWESAPPFGGAVGPKIYATAVMARALMAFYSHDYSFFPTQVGSALVSRARPKVNSQRQLKPFWGDVPEEPADDNLCFMLMPFSPEKLTDIYERYVKQPIEHELGLKCVRADDLYRSTPIMRDVWGQINRARIIVAELTDKNANVFYELGLAHVLGKPVILIAQSVDFIPFDLRGIRTIVYNDGPAGYEDLAKRVVEFVKTELTT